jgi:hypothetical protein
LTGGDLLGGSADQSAGGGVAAQGGAPGSAGSLGGVGGIGVAAPALGVPGVGRGTGAGATNAGGGQGLGQANPLAYTFSGVPAGLLAGLLIAAIVGSFYLKRYFIRLVGGDL